MPQGSTSALAPIPFGSPAGSAQLAMRSGCSFAERDRTGILPPTGAGFPRERHPGLVEGLPFRIGVAADETPPLGKGRDPVEVLANVLLADEAYRIVRRRH